MTKKPITRQALLLCSALVTTTAANAQAVYRCANAYSQSPCPNATLVDVADARSAAQQAEAQRAAYDERRLAADMRRDRLADERLARANGLAAASLSGASPARPMAAASAPHASHKKRHGLGKVQPRNDDFVAFDPSSRKRRSGS